MKFHRSLIALLTDFGEDDYFVASLKGVIASINPGAKTVDITHRIPSFDIGAGAFVLFAACRFFPPGTIFLAVVDPGVGTEREILVAETDLHTFVGPNNGLLSLALEAGKLKQLRYATNPDYFLPEVSRTFEARDKMAPIAAHLAANVPLSEFGASAAGFIRTLPLRPEFGKKSLSGRILYVDKFGNLVTNIPSTWKDVWPTAHAPERDRPAVLEIGGVEIVRFSQNYLSAPERELFVLEGSQGLLEISLRRSSAAARLGVRAGDPVRLSLRL